MKVFLTHNLEDLDAYFGRALVRLAETDVEVVRNPEARDLSTEELIDAAAECQVVIAHRATPGDPALFEQSPDLVAFLRTAVDISTVDVEAASANGVLVARAAKSFVPSTAELALGLLIDVMRNVSESTVDYRNGVSPAQRPGRQLRGQTAGIIGYGAVGTYLADLLRAVGMRVLVHDPYVDVAASGGDAATARADGSMEQVESLHVLLAGADVVFPLAPDTPSTHRLIDEQALSAMRPGAILVNVSRGELLDEKAVSAALDSGHLGGLAMDVGSDPDQRPAAGLARRPGVVATPHLGGLTPENADAQAMSAVDQVVSILNREMPVRIVNPESAGRVRSLWASWP